MTCDFLIEGYTLFFQQFAYIYCEEGEVSKANDTNEK